MLKHKISRNIYKNIAKPFCFLHDAEKVHNGIVKFGERLGSNFVARSLVSGLFSYSNESLNQNIDGVFYSNPIGLAAGFDYDGHAANILKSTGFGFNTVGTVTAEPYVGNEKPRLARLPKSRALLVNKGFKSDGADVVEKRLDSMNISSTTLGISIGSTNIPKICTLPMIIDDYIYTFNKFKDKNYVKYFELNISCPNAKTPDSKLGNPTSFESLVKEVAVLGIKKPIYVKMAHQKDFKNLNKLVEIGIGYGMNGFIFSNLYKDRKTIKLTKAELASVKNLKGNFSGKPTEQNANKLIRETYKNFGKDTVIIGCGGVFSAENAYEKIKAGASLVQLITGMIYEGPQLIGEINHGLAQLLKRDGYKNISEAVGAKVNS